MLSYSESTQTKLVWATAKLGKKRRKWLFVPCGHFSSPQATHFCGTQYLQITLFSQLPPATSALSYRLVPDSAASSSPLHRLYEPPQRHHDDGPERCVGTTHEISLRYVSNNRD